MTEASLKEDAQGADERQVPVKTLLFYERPVPLNREIHRGLRLTATQGDYGFARATNSIPLAAVEFAQACRDYPIVFAGNAPETVVPAVLLGLRADENLFVDDEDRWAQGYIPAFVRRYPFVLAEKPGGADFTVCVDEGYPGFGTEAGESLFGDDGTDGVFLQRALGFLGEFQGQMQRTQAFAARLNELNLLQSKVAESRSGEGRSTVLQGFYVVDEQVLKNLDDVALRGLLESGELGWIYMHLISLGNIEALSARLDNDRPTVQ